METRHDLGQVIPDEVFAQIIKVLGEKSIIRRISTIIPLGPSKSPGSEEIDRQTGLKELMEL